MAKTKRQSVRSVPDPDKESHDDVSPAGGVEQLQDYREREVNLIEAYAIAYEVNGYSCELFRAKLASFKELLFEVCR